MKIGIKIIVAVLMFGAFSCSSDDSNTETESPQKLLMDISEDFNGQVLVTTDLSYDGNRVVEVVNTFSSKTKFTYDTDGSIVLEERNNYNFMTQSYDDFDEETTFFYENEILDYDIAVDEDGFANRHDYTLNAIGQILEYGFSFADNSQGPFTPNGELTYTYSNGNLMEEVQTDSDDQEVYRIEYTFDTNKNLMYNVDMQYRRQVRSSFFLATSTNNLLTRKLYSNNQLEQSYTFTYEYDEDGYPTMRESYNNLTDDIEETLFFNYSE